MNIVFVDSGQLAGEADFPDINLPKYGWLQFVELEADEVEERCWRADIIISTNTPITAEVIKESYKLRLIIAAGDDTTHIDHNAAGSRDVSILNVPGLTGDSPENTKVICNQVVDHINTWLKTTAEKATD